MAKQTITENQTIKEIYSNPKFSGKHVLAIKNKIYSFNTGEALNEKFKKVIKQYPKESPLTTYVPKKGILIL